MKKMLALVLTLNLMLGGVSATTASEKSRTEKKGFKEEIAHIPAYYEIGVFEGNIGSQILEDNEDINLNENLLYLTDKEALKMVRKNLKEVIKRKNDGSTTLFWNIAFVEGPVKNYLPDLYGIIKRQISEEAEIKKGEGLFFRPKRVSNFTYKSGYKIICPQVTAYHSIWGYKLYTFWNKIKWSWDDTKVCSVEYFPNHYIYDDSWHWSGLSTDQSYSVRDTDWYVEVVGEWWWLVKDWGDVEYTHICAYLDPGGTYAVAKWRSDP